jgi:hypothetical protein
MSADDWFIAGVLIAVLSAVLAFDWWIRRGDR